MCVLFSVRLFIRILVLSFKTITLWRTVLPEKLTVPQLLKKLPVLYKIRRFITVFTRSRDVTLPWARSIQSMPYQTSQLSILILSPSAPGHSKRSPLRFPHQNLVCNSSIAHTCCTFFLIWSPELYLVWSTKHKAPCYVVFSIPCYLVRIKPKYPPEHQILEKPQSTFLPQCEQPNFTPLLKTAGKIIIMCT